MKIQSDIIIYFIKLYNMNLCAYYSFKKITNIKEHNYKKLILILIINLFLVSICTYIKFNIHSSLSIIVLCFCYGSILGIITEKKVGFSLVASIISYAISIICLGISIIIEFIPYRLLKITNNHINLVIILLFQFTFLYIFFKIKRLKNGFDFLNKRLNNEVADIMIINISIIILLIYCLNGTHYDSITWSLLITFVILGVTMFIMVQRTLTMYYKQKLLENTLQEYKKEIKEKEAEIQKLNNEKYNVSKITHEFYNRQKALEILVSENINNKNSKIQEKVSKNILNIIKSLTEEYSEEFINIKDLPKLQKTGIIEIDNMFNYMQKECIKNNIEFKLKIEGDIYYLINNIIPKNKLETLIGDHLRDAINAVKSSETENKEILAVIGIKDKKYELAIYDTGIEFEIETLPKLGKEPITTHKETGGSGIGFMTTFETLKECKASLIIEEYKPNTANYTKAVIIRFDNESQYKIYSYRTEKIKNACKNEQDGIRYDYQMKIGETQEKDNRKK